MIIAYAGWNEVLVCTSETELELLKTWFADDSGRDVEEYDRSISDGILEIRSGMLGVFDV